ncbi:MAG: hypothetical protein MRERV_14c054 [Mycoplasmataceae bacterium RV_VA103A]|nr:MAG: hypothetical protein MRERV_21c010 [Mycoplasmataceae bacterium RV_VA103A]KLL04705.1 MAG: hypothetical protein MRERV_14c054 [Mycoplasmataceae bacterium RV_VA103A]
MQIYIVKYEKNNEEYRKIILKITNEFTSETHWYSGFLKEVEEQRNWGKKGELEQVATIYKDEPTKK